MPRVTVFIPTYNRARPARFAIESVLAQTYGDFGSWSSDNASDRRTRDVVARYRRPAASSTSASPRTWACSANHNWFLQRVETPSTA